VVLLEKNAKLGGSTAWSIGSVTASATPHQQKRGIVDTPQEHFNDMPLFAANLRAATTMRCARILCDEVPEAFRWLLSLGVRFHGPMPEPPHAKPRMHNVLPNSLSYIYHLGREARKRGVELRLGAHASALTTTGVRVTGVDCVATGASSRCERSFSRQVILQTIRNSRRVIWVPSKPRSRA